MRGSILASVFALLTAGCTYDVDIEVEALAHVTFAPGESEFTRIYRTVMTPGPEPSLVRSGEDDWEPMPAAPRQTPTYSVTAEVAWLSDTPPGSRFEIRVTLDDGAEASAVLDTLDEAPAVVSVDVECPREWGDCVRDAKLSIARTSGLDSTAALAVRIVAESAYAVKNEHSYRETLEIPEVRIP